MVQHGRSRQDHPDLPKDILQSATDGVGLTPAYQPVVSLPDQRTVGFEALARWPELGDPPPEAVFDYATESGQIDQLDQRCLRRISADITTADLPAGALVLVNSEPAAALDELQIPDPDSVQTVVELTERRLLEHPRELLAKVGELRARGFGIAIDDVGADLRSLAVLDILGPDIVKLHLHHLYSGSSEDQARLMSAVLAHIDRTGAELLVEGIETDVDLERAVAFGATLGQGYLFGAPTSLDSAAVSETWKPPTTTLKLEFFLGGTPFDILSAVSAHRVIRKRELLQLSRFVERQTTLCADAPMMLTALQQEKHFTERTRAMYEALSSTAPLVAVFALGMPAAPVAGVRGVDLTVDDPICHEWIVVAVGTYTSCALVGREIVSVEVAEPDRQFETIITYNRPLVLAAARTMLQRMP